MEPPHKKLSGKKARGKAGHKRRQLSHLRLPFYLKSVQLASYEKWMEDLNQNAGDAENVQAAEEMILTINQADQPDGQISVGTLNSLLDGLKQLSESIAVSLFKYPGEKGKIPLGTLDPNDFMLMANGRNFRAVLDVKHSAQSNSAEMVRAQIVGEMVSLMNASESVDQLTETSLEIGEETVKSYAEWIKTFKEHNLSVDIEWHPSYGKPEFLSISNEKAEEIYGWLSDFSDMDEDEVEVSGYLSGANMRTRTFEIVTDKGEKIKGRMSKDAVDKIAHFGLNNQCTARLNKVTARDTDHIEKVSWTLKDIQ